MKLSSTNTGLWKLRKKYHVAYGKCITINISNIFAICVADPLPELSRLGEPPTRRTKLRKKWGKWEKIIYRRMGKKWGNVPLLPSRGWESGYASVPSANLHNSKTLKHIREVDLHTTFLSFASPVKTFIFISIRIFWWKKKLKKRNRLRRLHGTYHKIAFWSRECEKKKMF